MKLIIICVLPFVAAGGPEASEKPEFPVLGDYLTVKGNGEFNLSEFINSHYIRIKLPTTDGTGEEVLPPHRGRASKVQIFLLLFLVVLKIKSAVLLTVIFIVVKSFLAGLTLSRTVAVVLHRERDRVPHFHPHHTDGYDNYWSNFHEGQRRDERL